MPVPVEQLQTPRRIVAQTLTQALIAQDFPDRPGNRVDIARIELPGAVAGNFTERRIVGAGDRHFAGHRFRNRQTEPLEQRGKHIQRRAAIQAGQRFVRHEADEPDAIAARRVRRIRQNRVGPVPPAAAEHQQITRPQVGRQFFISLDQPEVIFAGMFDPGDIEQIVAIDAAGALGIGNHSGRNTGMERPAVKTVVIDADGRRRYPPVTDQIVTGGTADGNDDIGQPNGMRQQVFDIEHPKAVVFGLDMVLRQVVYDGNGEKAMKKTSPAVGGRQQQAIVFPRRNQPRQPEQMIKHIPQRPPAAGRQPPVMQLRVPGQQRQIGGIRQHRHLVIFNQTQQHLLHINGNAGTPAVKTAGTEKKTRHAFHSSRLRGSGNARKRPAKPAAVNRRISSPA